MLTIVITWCASLFVSFLQFYPFSATTGQLKSNLSVILLGIMHDALQSLLLYVDWKFKMIITTEFEYNLKNLFSETDKPIKSKL
jgi:DNA-binding transcriptional regulator of glucitol operon